KGNNRMAFAPDGSLWVGQNASGWAGSQGIQRIVYTGKVPMDILEMSLTQEGFDLTFTQPVAEEKAQKKSNYKMVSYYYKYHKEYGSDRMDIKPVEIKEIERSGDRKMISLNTEPLESDRVYQLQLSD